MMNLDKNTTIYLTSKESKARIKEIPESDAINQIKKLIKLDD